MIWELAYRVPMFAGAASQTRCFLHIVNLVAKSLIRQFDVKKRDADMVLNVHVEMGAYEEEDKDENITADEDEDKEVVLMLSIEPSLWTQGNLTSGRY